MKRFNIPATLLCSLCTAALFVGLTLSGCTEVDDTLGAGFAPNSQEMRMGTRTIRHGFSTSLYRTDSIRTSNIGVGLLGTTRSDTFGLRSAGFYTQYTWAYCPDESEGFGYRPVFDSIQLGLLVTACGGDTTVVNTFDVYEVISDAFLQEHSDTLFYGTFDMTPYLATDEPLFSFQFPDQEHGLYTTSETVTMQATDRGRAYIDQLMLQSGPYAGGDLTGYTDADDFTSHFKGLYFAPRPLADGTQGGIYQIDLTQSGLALFCRNREEKDPTLIRDTLTSLYYFCDSNTEGGKASINTLRHDYAGSLLDGLDFDEQPVTEENPEPEYAEHPTCYVEGMAGVVTRIVLTEEFFKELTDILEEENATAALEGYSWQSLMINRAALNIYDDDGRYDWTEVVPNEAMIDRMDTFLPRLGLYTSYRTLTPVPDYNYVYESSGVTLNYGGYINRSQGCYTMDIAMYVQALWNSYNSLPGDRQLPPEEERTLYLAPEAYSVNTFQVMSGQGAGATNPAPLKLELTYTLIK